MTWPPFSEDVKYELGYGPFPGGDPREFRPDYEDCTDEEIARWYRACNAAKRAEERGEPVKEWGPSCLTLGDGSVWNGTGLGIGTIQYLVVGDHRCLTQRERTRQRGRQ